MANKPILVVFEGVDKSGKTTLLNLFNRKTNFKYVVLDRFTTSSKVYDYFYGRERFGYYNHVEVLAEEDYNILVVYCHAPSEMIRDRLRQANETLPKELSNIGEVKMYFEYILDYASIFSNVLKIDTSEDKLKCLITILNKVEEMENGK